MCACMFIYISDGRCDCLCCSVLQCVAACCSVLQCKVQSLGSIETCLHIAVGLPLPVLQCVAVCCSELQRVAVRCSVMQYVVM